ncbi:ABC transporter substrate-binding protein [Tessaracoccus lubricantis]|uniref:ABC transporter substrate-binding protein n=1 Tax=Tessaracoccus lubricantis TaxID=545543 RepID=A0ABP9F8J1_9ACTN
MRATRTAAFVGLAALVTLSACGADSTTPADGEQAAAANAAAGDACAPVDIEAKEAEIDAATATSAADFGGIDGLVAAAKAEGQLNTIALPHDWANYGQIIDCFKNKYGITINEQAPDASSAEEIAAAEANKGTDKAPDVFDLGTNVALSSTDYFAPYKVEQFDEIPADQKEETGLWVSDYTGVMVVGYNKTLFGEITSIDELTDAKFAGTVALNGKPAEAGAAFNGFLLANLANGGSMADPQPGLDYFKKLNEAKVLNLTDVTPGTIESGEHGVVFDWSYNMVPVTEKLEAQGVEWATFLPEDIALGSYYKQAINVDAPNPAAARLWQEFLYSAAAQNLWAEGGAVPVLNGLYGDDFSDEAKAAAPQVDALVSPTTEEADAITAFLQSNWDSTIS